MSKKFEIYSVPTYKYVLEQNKSNSAQCFSSRSYKKLVNELETNDCQYHLVTRKDDMLKLNIDIDGMHMDLIKKFFKHINRYLKSIGVNEYVEDIKTVYTVNLNGKLNLETNTHDYLYSHITFKNICATSLKQKEFWEGFIHKYPQYKDSCDFGHLGCGKKWFRLPNQTKEGRKKTEHKIIEGEMKDFILHYIPKNCVNIDHLIISKPKEEKPDNPEFEKEVDEKDKKLVELLDWDSGYQDWHKYLWVMKSIGLDFDLFHSMSKTGKKYTGLKDCLRYWNLCRTSNINKGLLHSLAKRANEEKYREIMGEDKIEFFEPETEEKNIITISNRFLLPSEHVVKFDDSTQFQREVKKFYESENIKCLSVKSPYGTGKTQMIKSLINTYDPKRILWLSYRKTLTNNVIGGEKFGEEYNFKNYMKGDLSADRLMIQLESTLKLYSQMDFIDDDTSIYPSYDLVIIDEIESILKHFDSHTTFHGKSKDTFEFIQNVIINSSKLMVLDGDVGNRAYDYIKSFGQCVNIVNDIKINQKNFKVTQDGTKFYKNIVNKVSKGEKVVIVSMPTTKCETYADTLGKQFPDKKILYYTGSSDDEKKKDFNDVTNIWNKCDVLIYSPTCEAGVNFDINHFDRMYGIISAKSTTPRGFLQMLARIRKVKKNEIIILNECFDQKTKVKEYYTYPEVKSSILYLEGLKVQCENKMINGKMCKVNNLSPYDINYIYNRVEELNAGNYYFLSKLESMCISKGHTFERLTDKPENEEGKKKNPEITVTKIDQILEAEDLTEENFKEYLIAQQSDNATKDQKLAIDKHMHKLALGLDELNENVLKTFTKDSIKKFTSLIDIQNVKETNDNHRKEIIDKAKLINQLIKDLGFKNIFDNQTKLKRSEFLEKVETIKKNNIIFTNPLNTKVRFNLAKTAKVNTSNGFLGFVNSILKDYNINITQKRVTVNYKNDTVYSLSIINDINELLEYKIKLGFKLHDEKSIRTSSTTKTYAYLINQKKMEEVQKKLKAEQKNKQIAQENGEMF